MELYSKKKLTIYTVNKKFQHKYTYIVIKKMNTHNSYEQMLTDSRSHTYAHSAVHRRHKL